MPDPQPTIKGIFVNSHIEKLRADKGEAGLVELKRRYRKPLDFKNFASVPVREEIAILEIILDILHPETAPEKRSYEAGRLHFRNFTSTPLAKIIFSQFRHDFKTLMLNADNIAGHVFHGVRFESEELGPAAIKIVMDGNDYPIDHFKGLFAAWMEYAGLKEQINAQETAPGRYEYTMRW